jgi:hypothetical protein
MRLCQPAQPSHWPSAATSRPCYQVAGGIRSHPLRQHSAANLWGVLLRCCGFGTLLLIAAHWECPACLRKKRHYCAAALGRLLCEPPCKPGCYHGLRAVCCASGGSGLHAMRTRAHVSTLCGNPAPMGMCHQPAAVVLPAHTASLHQRPVAHRAQKIQLHRVMHASCMCYAMTPVLKCCDLVQADVLSVHDSAHADDESGAAAAVAASDAASHFITLVRSLLMNTVTAAPAFQATRSARPAIDVCLLFWLQRCLAQRLQQAWRLDFP